MLLDDDNDVYPGRLAISIVSEGCTMEPPVRPRDELKAICVNVDYSEVVSYDSIATNGLTSPHG